MELIYSEVDLEESEELVLIWVDDFKYLGVTLSTINDWQNK